MESLDHDWHFHLGEIPGATAPDYDDATWRQVDVPHDYVIEGTFTPVSPFEHPGERKDWHWLHGVLPPPPAICRRIFPLPADPRGERRWIGFDGVFRNSRYQGAVDPDHFETSVDGTHWTTAVDAGMFANIRKHPTLQEVRFAPVDARYVRFTGLRDVEDLGRVGAAELTVRPPVPARTEDGR